MKGIICVTVKLFLETDVDETEAQEIVDELNYDFKHEMVTDSEIIDYELM